MIRTTVTIEGKTYGLSQGTDVDDLKQSATRATQAGGGLIDFVIVGNRQVSVLISSGVPVIFEELEVLDDDRDTGDVHRPWDDIDYLD
ncbi:hypothetical protein [Rathayibacter tanaceti]|uniref:Uncharacterized protein n=2 Tax=Rathayibacter tanaceti TaxID=1671680 RepID=A0A162GJ04_9MICO|nr:hypothetical protein [Rathayibacter tanaceti]KZX21959.1 hypothetical protein ACH61_00878 [Rathayibacter tanaceti]QHC56792.1 hypothetical protein GSU10_14920 [Rathayibacter tanaceti]TCO33767.1 hypothetical protein EV639_11450 [Rathayibacter tanaceti]